MIAALILAATLIAMIYQLAAVWALRRFTRQIAPLAPPQAVTILKPLCGAEPDLLANLRSFWRDDWPDLRMVCGVADPDDPAAAVVRQLQAELPQADIRLVTGRPATAANAKIANVMAMMAQANGGILVIADSDMAAPPDYLPALVASLNQMGVGLATCLYVGTPAADLWSRLGAMGINHNFLPSALVAQALGRKDGCFGATMALHRDTLERMGGFAICADHLADDYALGQAVRRLGLSIALAPVLVTDHVHEAGFSGLLAHEIRWGRTIATLAPWSYGGTILTQPVMLALLGAIMAGPLGWGVLGAALVWRLLVVRQMDRALNQVPTALALVPLREMLSFVVFIAAFCGRSVRWRGRRYRIFRDGRLKEVAP